MNNIFFKINKFLNSLFKKKEESAKIKNPWAGLSSYEDPINDANPLKFYGREKESVDLFNLIDDNIVVTLYGKSGIGKTSLLNAGVFPQLRLNGYMPIKMRFRSEAYTEETFATHILDHLTKQITELFGENSIEIIDVIPENLNPESEDFVWNFFARRRFWDNDRKPIFPVIVLDQFEESIKNQRSKASLLLKQITYMANPQNMLKDTFVEDQYYCYDYNFRFVISIREDDLFRLEDIISINYLTFLRNGRYRLQNLSHDNAKFIVQNIGKPYIKPEDLDKVTELIINVSKDKEDGFIKTNVISLICSRLFDITTNQGKRIISLEDVEDYLSIDPFEEYYTTAVKCLSEGEKRFIETNFVSSDGRRSIIQESELSDYVKSYKTLIYGNTPIFRKIQSSTSKHFIELIHDGICPIVIKHRTIRLEKKNKTILSLSLLILGLLALWMLNTSVINDFVYFFLNIINDKKSIRYIDILTITELLSLISFPILVGVIVLSYKRKKLVAIFALLILFLPSFLYPSSFLNHLILTFSKISNNYRHEGIEGILAGFPNSFYVFCVYVICIVTLSLINLLGKRGNKNNNKTFWINLWNAPSVKLYLWVIAGFLFYKSIFNTGNFIINSYDSCWGILVIPLLTLNIFGISLSGKKNQLTFSMYVILLSILMLNSIMEIFPPIEILILYLISAFFISFVFFYKKNIFKAFSKSICNVFILAMVIILNIGYNPFEMEHHKIYKVFPWKIVISDENNLYGIYEANYGDTLLIPKFRKDSYDDLQYYSYLPCNNYTDTIKRNKKYIGPSSFSFPLQLYKKGSKEWKLTLTYFPKFENTISKYAHLNDSDSNNLIYKKGSNLFIKLRNDISRFCFTGDASIFLSSILDIDHYEEIIKNDLYDSLGQLSENDSIMTEEIVVTFIKAISRSFYMNMLKESLLKEHYNDFIELFASYYIPISLTSIISECGFHWTANGEYKWSLSLVSDSKGSYSHNFTNKFHTSLEGLNNNRIYAWNNLFYVLFNSECVYYIQDYSLNIENKIKSDDNILNDILKQNNEFLQKLYSYKNELELQKSNFSTVITHLKDTIHSKDSLAVEEIITSIIEIFNSSNKIKNSVSAELKTFESEMDLLSNSFKNIYLKRADRQFRDMITRTFNSLIKIISDNPANVYNGELISICKQLYVIGNIRGYNMEEYNEQMNYIIEKINSEPLLKLVKDVNESLQDRSQLINNLRKGMNDSNLIINQTIQRIDSL